MKLFTWCQHASGLVSFSVCAYTVLSRLLLNFKLSLLFNIFLKRYVNKLSESVNNTSSLAGQVVCLCASQTFFTQCSMFVGLLVSFYDFFAF